MTLRIFKVITGSFSTTLTRSLGGQLMLRVSSRTFCTLFGKAGMRSTAAPSFFSSSGEIWLTLVHPESECRIIEGQPRIHSEGRRCENPLLTRKSAVHEPIYPLPRPAPAAPSHASRHGLSGRRRAGQSRIIDSA